MVGCSTYLTQDGPPRYYKDVSKIPDAVPKAEPPSQYGNPRYYDVWGRRYHVLQTSKGYSQIGYASWYGRKFSAKRTSSGIPYDPYAMTAASKVLPIPTYVKVTNLKNGRSVIVKVNDRGPFKANRIIDLSYAAAIKLGYAQRGTTLVRVTAIDPHTWYKHKERGISTDEFIVHHPSRALLQAGAFKSYHNALRIKYKLKSFLSEPIQVVVDRKFGYPLYRVRIGPIRNYEEADRIQRKLEQHNLPEAVTVTS